MVDYTDGIVTMQSKYMTTYEEMIIIFQSYTFFAETVRRFSYALDGGRIQTIEYPDMKYDNSDGVIKLTISIPGKDAIGFASVLTHSDSQEANMEYCDYSIIDNTHVKRVISGYGSGEDIYPCTIEGNVITIDNRTT